MLLLWLGVQLAALLLAAAHGPLSASLVQPPEGLAIQIMLVAQIAAASLLFPFLLRSAGCSLLVILTSWPFVQLAGFLSATSSLHMLGAAGCVSLWLLSMALISSLLHTRAQQLSGVAIAAAVSLGGAILWYTGAEFAARPPTGAWAAWMGPIAGALLQLRERHILAPPWIFLLACLLIALAARVLAARKRSALP